MITHSNSTINVFLAAAPPDRASFGIPLHLVDQATNSLNGVRVATYTSPAEVRTAESAGYLSTAVADNLVAAFSQQPAIGTIKVGRVDTGGGENWAQGLQAVAAADPDFYLITAQTRAAADLLLIGAEVASMDRIASLQTSDGDCLTAGHPAALAALEDNGRVALTYHNDDTEPGAIAWAIARLVFDPDTISAPWKGQVLQVGALATLTGGQRDACIANNINLGLPFSSASYYVKPGRLLDGRPVYERITGDWFKARLREDFELLELQATARGEKLVVDATGQGAGIAVIQRWINIGINAKHFNPGQYLIEALEITTADQQAGILRFRVTAQNATDADSFDINVYLQRENVVEV